MNARETPVARPLARVALYEEVAELLRARIFSHELAPGSWVDEQAIAVSLGISRTPLREALKVLASEGLVILKPRRGCYVAELSEQDLDEVFPVMALLEGRCTFEATRRITAKDLIHLDEIHQDLERGAAAGDADRFFAANDAFHSAIHDIAGNGWLKHLIDDTRKVIKLTRRHSLAVEGRIEQSLDEHREILAALHKKDPDLAAQRMHDHMLSGRAALSRLSEKK